MPVRTRPAVKTDYVSAGRIRVLTGMGTHGLLRLVAIGLVKFRVEPGIYPRYCVADVRRYLEKCPARRSTRKAEA